MAAPRTAPARVGEVKFRVETTAGESIATASTYWATSPKKIQAWDVAPALTRPSEDDQSMAPSTSAFSDLKKFLTGKAGSISFTCYLSGLAAAAADTVAMLRDDLGQILYAALGGESLGTSTTVAAGGGAGATTALKVASAAGLLVGQAVRVQVTAGGAYEMRRIEAISGANVTLDQDLSSTPTTGQLVSASATYYPLTAPLVDLSNASHTTFAALFRGYDSEDEWQARGCFPQIEFLDLGPTKIPKLKVTLHAMDWEFVTGVGAGSAFTEGRPTAHVNTGLYMRAQGTLTRNLVHCKDLAVKLGFKVAPIPSPSAQQGIAGHIFDGGRTTLEFSPYFDTEWNVGYEAVTPYLGGVQLGSSCLLTFPKLYIDETPARDGGGPATAAKVVMHAATLASATTEIQGARIAIHRFGT